MKLHNVFTHPLCTSLILKPFCQFYCLYHCDSLHNVQIATSNFNTQMISYNMYIYTSLLSSLNVVTDICVSRGWILAVNTRIILCTFPITQHSDLFCSCSHLSQHNSSDNHFAVLAVKDRKPLHILWHTFQYMYLACYSLHHHRDWGP